MAKDGVEELTLRTCTAGHVVLSWNSDKIGLYVEPIFQDYYKVLEDDGSVEGSRRATFNPQYGAPADKDDWDTVFRTTRLWAKAVETSAIVGDIHLTLSPVTSQAPPDLLNLTVLSVESVDVHTSDAETAKVQSFQTGGTEHFVCAKNTGDVILAATLTPDTPAAADAITWQADGATIASPAIGTDKTTAKLPSGTSQKIAVRIRVGTCVCWSGTAWVVWSNPTISNTPNTEMVFITGNQTRLRMQSPEIAFSFDITPSEITDQTKDVPNLSGAKYSDPPDGLHWDGVSRFTEGADKKWDISRQMNTKILSSIADTNVQKQVLDNDPFYNNHPTAFPWDPVLGNDDPFTGGEDNDSYQAPNIGKLTATDNPSFRADSDFGSVGDTMEIRFAMKEFTRLNLNVDGGPKWFAISDHDQAKWKYFLNWIKKDEAVDNVDYNGDGDKNDRVWINNGSVVAYDHEGF